MKCKGEVISLIKQLQLFRHHKVTVPMDEKAFLDEVFHQKKSSAQPVYAAILLSGVTVTWIVKRGMTVAWIFN